MDSPEEHFLDDFARNMIQATEYCELDDFVTCGKCGQFFVDEEGEFIPCACDLEKIETLAEEPIKGT